MSVLMVHEGQVFGSVQVKKIDLDEELDTQDLSLVTLKHMDTDEEVIISLREFQGCVKNPQSTEQNLLWYFDNEQGI